jgi:3-oxoacyl-[acyl-carrier-protein] synthase III
MLYAQIIGWGMHVPSRVVPNESFVKMGLDTTNEWISSRTGIQERRVANRNEATSDMAVQAARRALQVAEVRASSVDLIVVATCTPDYIMPATASLVQNRLGARRAGAIDLNAACSGFVYALAMAAGQIEAGRSRQALVIGADELSLHLDWKDRSTCVLFGDGAGAVLLRADSEPGVMASTMGSDGSGADLLYIPGGGSRYGSNGRNGNGAGRYLRMNGPQIYRWATRMMARAADEVIKTSNITPDKIDLFIPHQANLRIIEMTAKRLGIDQEKVFSNVGRYGNTSAASIPIALCEAIAAGRVDQEDNIVLSSFGAGLSWAALALRWTVGTGAKRSRWVPLRQSLESRVAAVRSVVRRQERRVRASIDERFRSDGR